jgi:hypothetical protein
MVYDVDPYETVVSKQLNISTFNMVQPNTKTFSPNLINSPENKYRMYAK